PRSLEIGADGSVLCGGARVDLIYRFLELRELAEMEAGGARLRGLRRAFETSRVLPAPTGGLEPQSALEIKRDPRFEPLFTPLQRRILRAHVPWTRLLRDCRTTDPAGRKTLLPEWTRRHRARLVIKPNRSCGGDRVVMGADVDDATWSSTLDE